MLQTKNRKKNQDKPAVALIAPFSHATVVQSIINSAKYLAMQGYLVDVFTVQEDNKFQSKIFDEDNIEIYLMKSSILEKWRKLNSKFTYFLEPLIKAFEDIIRFLVPPHSYSFIIGFDPEGLIRAGILSQVWRVPYLYHSLEIYEHDSTAPRKDKFQKKLEDWFSQRALFCFSQTEKRCEILAEENGLERNEVLVVFNSALGNELLPEKSSYLREKFNINKDKYIVLAVGSLIIEHCIEEILISVDEWPDNFVLVLHGWFSSQESERLIRQEIELRNEKVFVSTDLLDGDQKYKVFQSVDVGLVFFQAVETTNYMKKNFIYAAGSAGKLFDFMRTGVPIIANDIPGMRDIVEKQKCGIVVESPKDIGKTLTKIMEEYEFLRNNSLACYGSYEFGECYSQVLKHILGKIKT